MTALPASLDTAVHVGDAELPCSGLHVAILLGSYNGESFFSEQLAPLARQTHSDWILYVSDDGSVDRTLELSEAERNSWGGNRLKVLQGPRRGFVANFLSLVCREDIQADFFAWCDQGDIWCDDKLEVALAWLKTTPEDRPAIYCGRTEMICESGLYSGLSPLFTRPPHFANALVQSIAVGNTMVFNQAARALLQEAGASLAVPSHDWWAYRLISGAGGVILYDPEPKVLYRQHDENLVGANSSWAARLVRMRMVFSGRFCEWNEQTVSALESMQHRLNLETRNTLGYFKSARNKTLPGRVLGCLRAGIYRQTLLSNLGLIFATLLKKI
jgi:glycosyltransferase involved in cell wall biosynthesis